MLSCLLNGQRINCINGIHTREQLKSWAKKRILLCPACGKPYEYCHGQIKIPYFRHMDKVECEDKYSEPETEEHLIGKKDLYEWLKKQPGVTDCELEGWIPCTKQRPDIMFKYNGQQCVLEYQCSPIATEYVERHELYQAADIKDIWICGTNKYFTHTSRKKYIQTVALGHYDPINKKLIIFEYNLFYRRLSTESKNKLDITLYGENFYINAYYGRNINNFNFIDMKFIDRSFANLNEIYKKQNDRRNITTYKPRISNVYYNMQKRYKRENQYHAEEILREILFDLSNDNWNFHLQYTKNKYNTFCYICAIPVVNTDVKNRVSYDRAIKTLKRDFFEKIKVWKLDIDKIQQKDMTYIKNILLPVMINNKDRLLSWHFGDFRILI